MKMIVCLALIFLFQGALGELVCEELPVKMCSFAVSSSGNRCLLETFESEDGASGFQCKTSQIIANQMHDYIESDGCVESCGVDRNSAGISSDALLETMFITQLCSPQCSQNCPNIVDLYYNLALAEGVVLGDLCKVRQTVSRRSTIQIQSWGSGADGPVSAAAPSSVDCAPAEAPM